MEIGYKQLFNNPLLKISKLTTDHKPVWYEGPGVLRFVAFYVHPFKIIS